MTLISLILFFFNLVAGGIQQAQRNLAIQQLEQMQLEQMYLEQELLEEQLELQQTEEYKEEVLEDFLNE